MLNMPRIYVLGCALFVSLLSAGAAAAADSPDPREDWIFVSDDDARYPPGCDAVSVVDGRTGQALTRGERHVSPGRLTTTPDGALVISVNNNNGPFIYVLRRLDTAWRRSRTDMFLTPGGVTGSRPALSPDGSGILLSRGQGIDRYEVANITASGLGQRTARYEGATAAEIVFSRNPDTAMVLDPEGLVYFLDAATLQTVREPIPYTLIPNRQRRLRNTNAAVSPDGRYLVVNTGDLGDITIVDLTTGVSDLVAIPGLRGTWGLAFNYAANNYGLLAVHGGSKVGVYRFRGLDAPSIVAETDVSGQSASSWNPWPEIARLNSLAWTGSGDGVVVAVRGAQEFRVLDLRTDGAEPELQRRVDFDGCSASGGLAEGLDVLTLNDRLAPPPTATPTACPTPAPSDTPAVTPTPTASPSPTATPTASPTSTPTPTPSPRPIYLPVALKEECIVGLQHVDVALVIDASTSMLEPTREGRTKLAAAVEAVRLFLGELDLPRDQAAIVEFNGGVRLLQGLTGDRAALADALNHIAVQRQTRIDLGVETAHGELLSQRHRAGNERVMIVLTDGRANPVAPGVAVERAAAAKADGSTVFTIGLGEELDVWALEAMASRPDYFYRAPDGEDLQAIYQAIAVAIPCPAESFWGG